MVGDIADARAKAEAQAKEMANVSTVAPVALESTSLTHLHRPQ